MRLRKIDTAPRDGTTIKVRDKGSTQDYFAKYWTKEELAQEEWDDVEPGWYERHNPAHDDDGDVRCEPDEWHDFSEDAVKY